MSSDRLQAGDDEYYALELYWEHIDDQTFPLS